MLHVIVIGDDHHNTLGIVRSLGKEDIKVDLIILKSGYLNYFTTKSKYINRFVVCESDETVIKNHLVLLAKGFSGRGVIIPACDKAALIVDNIKREISDIYHVGGISYKGMSLADFMHKDIMCRVASEVGISVPRCRRFNITKMTNVDEIFTLLKETKISFPLIFKPEASFSGSKSMIRVFENENMLRDKFKELPYACYLIQEYIKIDCEYGIQGVGFGKNHKAFIPGVIRKIRQSDNSKGSTTYAVLNENDYFFELTFLKRFVEEIGYSGIFDIEMVKSGDRYYFIEINLRNGAYGYAYTYAGVNLPYIYCKSVIDKKYPKDGLKIKKKVYLINEIGDISNILARKVRILTWLKQLVFADVKMIWNIKDNKPFWYRIVRK